MSGIGIVRVPSGMMHEHAPAVDGERREAVADELPHVVRGQTPIVAAAPMTMCRRCLAPDARRALGAQYAAERREPAVDRARRSR